MKKGLIEMKAKIEVRNGDAQRVLVLDTKNNALHIQSSVGQSAVLDAVFNKKTAKEFVRWLQARCGGQTSLKTIFEIMEANHLVSVKDKTELIPIDIQWE